MYLSLCSVVSVYMFRIFMTYATSCYYSNLCIYGINICVYMYVCLYVQGNKYLPPGLRKTNFPSFNFAKIIKMFFKFEFPANFLSSYCCKVWIPSLGAAVCLSLQNQTTMSAVQFRVLLTCLKTRQ
jgi:hypothetical protein